MTFRPLCLAAAAVLLATQAMAAGLSPWAGDDHGPARLVGAGAQNGTLQAGLEIKLASGWETYWKAPGQSGIPPAFDWSGSDNLAGVAVRWPVPQSFVAAGDTTLGYAGDVILPLAVTAKDPGKPVTLVLNLHYALCKNICIPAEARLVLPLAKGSAADAYTLARLEGFRARVPRAAAVGGAGPLAVRAATLVPSGTHHAVEVDVRAPAGATLFAAAPDGAAGVPQRVGDGQWRVPLPGPKVPHTIELVLAAGGDAVSVPVRLDGGAATP